jgi:hypothetical protein
MSVQERKFLYKKQKPIKNFRKIVSTENRSIYGVDLADYTGNEAGANRGYILVCIDYHSRFLMTKVINKKDMPSIEKALYEIFEQFGTPLKIHSDMESGLIHSTLIKENNIEVYHTSASEHNQSGGSPVAERVIRTIREKLEQLRDVTTARSWKQHVKVITNEYNYAKHSTTGMRPIEAFHLEDETPLNEVHKANLEKHDEHVKETFKPNKNLQEEAKVVVGRQKKTFEKGYTMTFSDKVLTIKQVLPTIPPTYLLSNNKFYYKEQIQYVDKDKVNVLERKRNK